jgi:hypothetical protein
MKLASLIYSVLILQGKLINPSFLSIPAKKSYLIYLKNYFRAKIKDTSHYIKPITCISSLHIVATFLLTYNVSCKICKYIYDLDTKSHPLSSNCALVIAMKQKQICHSYHVLRNKNINSCMFSKIYYHTKFHVTSLRAASIHFEGLSYY